MDNDVKQQPRLRRNQKHQLSEVRQRHGHPNNISSTGYKVSKSSKENSLPKHNRQRQIMKRKGQSFIRSTTSSPHHDHGIMDTHTPRSSAEPEREVIYVDLSMYQTNFTTHYGPYLTPALVTKPPPETVVRKRQGVAVSGYTSPSHKTDGIKVSKKLKPTVKSRKRYVARYRAAPQQVSSAGKEEEPVFEFETRVAVSLDSSGYLMTIIFISQIIIFGMALYSRSLHSEARTSADE